MLDFYELNFPSELEYGYSGGVRYKVFKNQSSNGYITRILTSKNGLREFDVSDATKTEENRDILQNFYHQVYGSAIGFRFKDYNDYIIKKEESSVNEDHLLKGYPFVFMFKKYQFSNLYEANFKRIYKPNSNGLIKVWLNDVELDSLDYIIDFTKGLITFQPIEEITGFTIASDTLGTVTKTNHGLTNNKIIYLDGFIDSAEILNKKTYTITVIDADHFTLNYDTTSIVQPINYTDSVIQIFPQYDDVVQFQCEYDIPVIFKEDFNPFVVETWNTVSFQPSLQEILILVDEEDEYEY